jgi:hypothetical protein
VTDKSHIRHDSSNTDHLKQLFEVSSRQTNRRDVTHLLAKGALVVATTALSGVGIFVSQSNETKYSDDDVVRRKKLLTALGITPDSKIIYADELEKYPKTNVLSGRRVPSLRSQKVAVELTNFAFKTERSGEYKARIFSQVFDSSTSITPYETFLRSSPLSMQFGHVDVPQSLVAISAAKANPATRDMMNLWETPDFPNIFLSLDRRWCADLKINQFINTNDQLTGNDPIFGAWSYNECLIINGHEHITPKYDGHIHGTHTQTTCYFYITKLRSPFDKLSQQQTVVIISAMHGRGLAAAGQLFSVPVDAAAKRFIDDLITLNTLCDSWQILAEASDFSKLSSGEYYANSITTREWHEIFPERISV